MKKNKIIILIIGLSIALISGLSFHGFARAVDSPAVYISPTNLTKNIGQTFDISVNIKTADQKVCAVEGKLIFNQLSCQTIELKEGILAQTSPSCANSYFLLGIPECTTTNKTLFTVKVKGDKTGVATVSFTNVDIIGEGVSISSASLAGNYTLISPSVTVPSCSCTDWSSWQSGDCDQANCSSNQRLQFRTRTCSPKGCNIETENKCVEDSTCLVEETIIKEPIVTKETTGSKKENIEKGLLASFALYLGENSLPILIIISLILLALVLFYFIVRKPSNFSSRKR